MKSTKMLELASNLQEVEAKRAQFATQLKAIESHYFDSGHISFETKTTDYNDKGTTESIEFDKVLLAAYLKAEIAQLKKESVRIIKELSEESAI